MSGSSIVRKPRPTIEDRLKKAKSVEVPETPKNSGLVTIKTKAVRKCR